MECEIERGLTSGGLWATANDEAVAPSRNGGAAIAQNSHQARSAMLNKGRKSAGSTFPHGFDCIAEKRHSTRANSLVVLRPKTSLVHDITLDRFHDAAKKGARVTQEEVCERQRTQDDDGVDIHSRSTISKNTLVFPTV